MNDGVAVKGLLCVCAVSAAILGARAETFAPSFKTGYDVHPSALVPQWSGAEPGVWTFDCESAFANARRDGRYTIMLFTAMWWCPHCQPLEKFVLLQDEFQSYVKEAGFYLTALDFPYRDGLSNWCWLWDPAYRAANGIGDWTPQQVSDELISRFEFQNAWTQGGAVTTNRNVLVEISDGVTNLVAREDIPLTVYRRVGYPTLIVVKPDGTEAGRFSFNKRIPAEEAIEYVVGNIRNIVKTAGGSELFEDPGRGGLLGSAATQYTGWLADGETGEVSGTFTVKAAKRNKKTGAVKLTATLQVTGGRKVSLKGMGTAPTTNAVAVLEKGADSVSVVLGANGLAGTYTSAAGRTYALQGGRNVFAAKDPDAKTRAAKLQTGFWTLAVTNGAVTGAGAAFAGGAGGLSVAVKAKGKVKVTGVLGDGTKVSVSAQGVMGDDGLFAVPVCASLYSKKGGLAFALLFRDGQLKDVVGLTDWVAKGKTPFVAECGLKHAATSGASVADGEALRIELNGLTLPACGLSEDGFAAEFEPAGTKWRGEGVTDLTQLPIAFALTFAPKTGLIKGTLTLSAKTAAGKTKKVKAKVFGVVVNGNGECTAIFPKVGSWTLRITSACGGGGC